MKNSERTFIHFLEDIEESIEKIISYTNSYSFKKFRTDDKTVDAVIRNLEIIGEASNKIPVKIKTKYPLVPWDEMYRMRNKAIHEYFGVDYEIIWDIVINNLPQNLKQIKEILEIERGEY
ncbi:MAG: DUF86 domain-containing protein [Bacteroidales bacterium]|nr:DUF86 domain-containing protein [Bacteroidales bacterium]